MRQLWSNEAEQSVLGGLMLDDKVFDDVIEVGLKPDTFQHTQHQLIFKAIESLMDEKTPVDVITVAERLEDRQQLDTIGGASYLSRLVDVTPSIENTYAYAKRVCEYAIERIYYFAAMDIKAALEDEGYDDHAARVAQIQQILMTTEKEERANTIQSLGDVAKNVLDKVDEASSNEGVKGLATGWQHIDYRLGGLQPGEFVVVGARPGMGKTAYMLNMIRNVVIEQKSNALVFSLEMPNVQMGERMASAAGSVNLGLIKSGKVVNMPEQLTKFASGMTILKEAHDRLFFDEEPALPINELIARAKRLHRRKPLGLVVVDHIGLVESTMKTDNEPLRIGQISRALKKLAKQLGCPVLGLCQVNRECEKRRNKRPMMSDLRMSGAIEQDADVIQFLYRDEYYNENTQYPAMVEVISAKVRNGEKGSDFLSWKGQYQQMKTIEQQPDSGSKSTVDDFHIV